MFKAKSKILFAAIIVFIMSGIANAGISPLGYCAWFGSVLNPDPLHSDLLSSDGGASRWSHIVSVSANLAIMPLAYNHMVNAWGVPDGRFHFKDDWSGDNLALNDEVSHLVVSYKLTQLFHSGYRALGYSEGTARLMGVIEAAVIVTAVEYPIDAYNPTQGFGVSDLLFDYAGIGLGYLKIADSRFADWDLKVSVKSFKHANRQVIGDVAED